MHGTVHAIVFAGPADMVVYTEIRWKSVVTWTRSYVTGETYFRSFWMGHPQSSLDRTVKSFFFHLIDSLIRHSFPLSIGHSLVGMCLALGHQLLN